MQETKSDGTMSYRAKTRKQFEKIANDIKTEITDYSSNSSKWSGTVHTQQTLINGEAVGVKEWSCDISIMDTADDGVMWHEMLHSCSASYYDSMIYVANQRIEEASVEFLKQQICKERNITSLSSYAEYTTILQALNNKFQFGTDMEFAKELFNIPLPDRYQWLEDKVGDALRALNAGFEDYNDVIGFVKRLRGGFDGAVR